MASEPIECQVVALRVSIHCQGCKKKVKKVLQNISGVYRCEIDARSNKVVATVSTELDPYVLVAKLRKSGKQAELWPEQQQEQPPPPPAESQGQERKNDQPDEPVRPSEPAEKRGADTAEAAAAEPSNPPQPSPPEPNQSAGGEAPNPAAQDSKENASDGGDEAAAASAPAPAQQGPSEAKGKAKAKAMQHPAEMERQPVDARVTVEYHPRSVGGGYVDRMPPPAVMSYNQVRPSVSASYYAPTPAPAPAPMPMPMARPRPSQGYIDEHYAPSYSSSNNYYYSNRSPAYEPYYYSTPQPAPYSYQYQYQTASSSEDYYYSAPPQRSAFSPPREGYGDMFNDENANSCTVM